MQARKPPSEFPGLLRLFKSNRLIDTSYATITPPGATPVMLAMFNLAMVMQLTLLQERSAYSLTLGL
jgi:hypothetical protein